MAWRPRNERPPLMEGPFGGEPSGAMVIVIGVATAGGWAATTVKGSALLVPPPGAGFVTVICTPTGFATAAAVMAALNSVALTNVVVRSMPFHLTTAPCTKPVPFTPRSKAG